MVKGGRATRVLGLCFQREEARENSAVIKDRKGRLDEGKLGEGREAQRSREVAYANIAKFLGW